MVRCEAERAERIDDFRRRFSIERRHGVWSIAPSSQRNGQAVMQAAKDNGRRVILRSVIGGNRQSTIANREGKVRRNQTKGYGLSPAAPQSEDTTNQRSAGKGPGTDSTPRPGATERVLPRLVAEQVHRMSQPLTALQGTVELALLSEHTAEAYRAALEESLEQLTRLCGIVNSLRDMTEAYASAGRKTRLMQLSVSRGPFDEATLAVEVEERLRRPRRKSGSSLPFPEDARSKGSHR